MLGTYLSTFLSKEEWIWTYNHFEYRVMNLFIFLTLNFKKMKISREVEYNTKKIFFVDNNWIKRIKKLASKNKSKKFRTCIHHSKKDLVHEMIVVHSNKTYVRPHKHNHKAESLYVIEGKATVVTFNKHGKILNFWKIGDQKSGLPFFYKMGKNTFHTFIFHLNILFLKKLQKVHLKDIKLS